MRSEIILIIIGMGAVTFLTRFASQAVFRQVGIPVWFDRWLKHVPTAILTALIVPSLLMPKGALDISPGNDYLLAGIFAAAIAYKFHNAGLTMFLGLAAVVLLRWSQGC